MRVPVTDHFPSLIVNPRLDSDFLWLGNRNAFIFVALLGQGCDTDAGATQPPQQPSLLDARVVEASVSVPLVHQLLQPFYFLGMCCKICGCLGFCTKAVENPTGHPSRGIFDARNHDTILKSAEAGCSYCDLVAQALSLLVTPEERQRAFMVQVFPDRPAHITTVDGQEPKIIVEIFALSSRCCVCSHWIMLTHHLGDNLDRNIAELGREVPQRPDSKASFQFLKTCYQTCHNEHVECRQDQAMLPKRVIDVSAVPYRLVEPAPGTRGLYAALSYKWSDWKSFTTRETYESVKQSIPNESLPVLFQDAILVCRSLGIDYIWIDSACIIQGDEHDWNEEAAKMTDVFENASLVIAASSMPDPGTSLFHRETGHVSTTVPLRFRESNRVFRARQCIQGGIHPGIRSVHRDLLSYRG